jgi:hypothetical protein
MIELNYLLEKAGLDLKRTRLVRHQDVRALPGRAPHDLWMAADGSLELYQRIQRVDRFAGIEWLVAFVATPLDETLFVGVYRISGVSTAPVGMADPVGGEDVGGFLLYEMDRAAALDSYAGRLVIDWGPGYRTWVQRPDRQDKTVVELRRNAIEPPFPGFTSFKWPIRQLSAVPTSWRGALSAVAGVYLLACRSTGQQYVGSAYGAGGFWARWENYFRTGHGGNEGMKLAPGNDYQVSILEFASPSLGMEDIIQMEARWKDKLLSREFGLNRN